MKKVLLSILMVGCLSVNAQTIKTPAPSPTQTVKQDFALSSIEVNYSRPSKKGRVVFGDLVPYGKMWRTGANAQTTVTFGDDVTVAGKALKAGKYTLITIPNKSEWEVLFCIPETSVPNYKAESEIMRVKVKASEMPVDVETFMIVFDNQTATKVNMELVWDKTAVDIPISTDIDTKVMADIDKALNKDNKPYFQGASYYFENGKDMNQALAWVNKAVEAQPKAYWVAHLKAKIQAKMGDKVGAIATAKSSMALAVEGKNDDYVALNQKLIDSLK